MKDTEKRFFLLIVPDGIFNLLFLYAGLFKGLSIMILLYKSFAKSSAKCPVCLCSY